MEKTQGILVSEDAINDLPMLKDYLQRVSNSEVIHIQTKQERFQKWVDAPKIKQSDYFA